MVDASKKSAIVVGVIATIISTTITTGTVLFTFAGERATALQNIRQLASRADDQEARLRRLEQSVGEISNDTKWLRRYFDKNTP